MKISLFSSMDFAALMFYLGLWLILINFCMSARWGPFHSFECQHPVSPITFVDAISFLYWTILTPFQGIIGTAPVRAQFCVFYSFPFISSGNCPYSTTTLGFCNVLIKNFGVRKYWDLPICSTFYRFYGSLSFLFLPFCLLLFIFLVSCIIVGIHVLHPSHLE